MQIIPSIVESTRGISWLFFFGLFTDKPKLGLSIAVSDNPPKFPQFLLKYSSTGTLRPAQDLKFSYIMFHAKHL